MIIQSIELKGHGSYRDYTKVEVPLGIIGILGQYDEDPLKSNGSGKSTLVMSIIYALFGEGEFNILKEIVNDNIVDGEMFVKVNFILNGINYIVERGMRNGTSYLDFKGDGVRVGDSDKIKQTQQEIINVLNMDYTMFTVSGFFEQDALDKFINTDPEILRQHINKILGIELWRLVSKISKKKFTKTNEKIDETKQEIEKLENAIADIEKDLLNKLQVESNLKKITEELNIERDILKNLNLSKSKIETLKNINEKIIILTRSMNSNKEDAVEEEKRISRLKNDILEKEKAISELELIPEDKVNKIEFMLDSVNSKVLTYDNNRKTARSNLSKAKQELDHHKDMHKRLCAGKCKYCEQEITQEYVDKQAEVYSVEIRKAIEEIEKCTEEHDKYIKGIIELEDEISNLSDLASRYRTINSNYETNKILFTESIKGFRATLELAEKNLEKLNKTLNDAVLEKNELEKRSDELQKEIPEGIDQKITNTEHNIRNLENTLNTLNVELGKLEQLEQVKNTQKNKLEDTNKKLKELKKYLYIYNTLTKKYKDYARQKFEESIISIQNVADGIIKQIIPNMSVKIYEDDSKLKRIVIGFEIDGKSRSYKRLSGGQRTIANIALRLGFSKIIQARAKSHIGFVVLDEPFGALDEKNRELISRMLTVMLQWFKQILVISHVDNIKDFPHVICVGMTSDGVSYIK